MIVLFTDFGWQGPYVGQLKIVLQQLAPHIPVMDLMHDAPAFNPKASAYLLHAISKQLPSGTIVLGVVDPGVGDPKRRPIIVQADDRWYVGPDNGLFEIVVLNATTVTYWHITWRPEVLSNTFHGRDLFAPVAAMLAKGEPAVHLASPISALNLQHWPADLAEIVYIDRYGNAITGLRSGRLTESCTININGLVIPYARTFTEVAVGNVFWHVNSINLIELAGNRSNLVLLKNIFVGQGLTASLK
ncbi:MAG: SAM-dependent chlorinase/fluorinase [Gammaproteobacteria bacterium]|nr:SAM-dependent chlorinase/fluorinase [Gammaproteobacteria bacterium]